MILYVIQKRLYGLEFSHRSGNIEIALGRDLPVVFSSDHHRHVIHLSIAAMSASSPSHRERRTPTWAWRAGSRTRRRRGRAGRRPPPPHARASVACRHAPPLGGGCVERRRERPRRERPRPHRGVLRCRPRGGRWVRTVAEGQRRRRRFMAPKTPSTAAEAGAGTVLIPVSI